MGERLDTFVEYAHGALPRFELFRLHPGKRIVGSHLTDVLVDDNGVPQVMDRTTLARFLCLITVATAIADDGRPHRLDLRAPFGVTPVAEGGGYVVLTPERLVGVMSAGDSAWGRLATDRVVVWELDLRDIDAVTLTTQSGFLGKKEKPVTVHSHLPLMGIRLEVFAIPEEGGGGVKEKSSRPLMEALVTATTACHLAVSGNTAERAAALGRIRNGEWTSEPPELVADFTVASETRVGSNGIRTDRPHWTASRTTGTE